MQRYEQTYKETRKQIIINNFIGGVSWGLGATIGVAVIVALLTLIAKQIDVIPVIGTFVSDVINFVLQHNANFQK